MVGYLAHCMIDAKHPRASIETLLHAFLPFKHVDHTHPDSIISLCCADNGKQLAPKFSATVSYGCLTSVQASHCRR